MTDTRKVRSSDVGVVSLRVEKQMSSMLGDTQQGC